MERESVYNAALLGLSMQRRRHVSLSCRGRKRLPSRANSTLALICEAAHLQGRCTMRPS